MHSSEESADSSDDGAENTGEMVLRGHAISTPLVVLAGSNYPESINPDVYGSRLCWALNEMLP